jgi:D-beta-D-heptose 7-phosphate kinase/D-beta-D-heptose 1-phosphate adenosyltransferase
MKKVVVSGYFDPLHLGHLKMFKEAAELGDLVVIVNNTEQTINKKGYEFMPAVERAHIIQELSCVKEAWTAIDKNGTVCETLRKLQPDIFCNGGDRFEDNIPEKKICEELGIKMVFGVGGGKIQSSSDLVKNAKVKQERPWGYWEILEKGDGYKIKKLVVKPGKSLSYQKHNKRAEHWTIVSGGALVETEFGDGRQKLLMFEDESIYIPKTVWHRLNNPTSDSDLIVIEVSTGKYIEEDDIERKEKDVVLS